jgi:hypothetical protein
MRRQTLPCFRSASLVAFTTYYWQLPAEKIQLGLLSGPAGLYDILRRPDLVDKADTLTS